MPKTSASRSIINFNSGELVLPNTGFVWGGTTPPSGAETHRYTWDKVGKIVTLHISVSYVTAGTSLTSLTIPFPSDLPLPFVPTGFTAASSNLYIGSGKLMVTASTVPVATNAGVSLIRANAAGNGYEIFVTGTSGSQRVAIIDIVYKSV